MERHPSPETVDRFSKTESGGHLLVMYEDERKHRLFHTIRECPSADAERHSLSYFYEFLSKVQDTNNNESEPFGD
ncbi:hypothetical protein [Brevibacillus daliensis]|uniref:hypothetical protein n=1 Tax=Brevibacillus daliensis TaxID=2892995 RepID=UPI001E42C548|nr:hypothetical protein [Brevibacillus daliensis]